MQIPPVGTRVMIRHRLPAGSVPPLTDVIGHLVQTGPTLQVRTKRGDVVAVAVDDVVVIKALADAPVRTADIRHLEHAAALAWPGVEQQWVDGWFCRYGNGSTRRANSAVPLQFSVSTDLAAIADWYAARSVAPLVSVPDRLFRVPRQASTEAGNLVMACDIEPGEGLGAVVLAPQPDDEWMRIYDRDVPIEVLNAVIGGSVIFATVAGVAVARAAVTDAPDGTRWLGLSALQVAPDQRRHGHARALCSALLAWGADHGATRAYTQVLDDNASAIALFESLRFALHHRSRYIRVDRGLATLTG
ncbi:GNAT family N-acetyltransferase [Mycolicibacterium tusciae]|jgi:GNAT superfamily N-acetyltransferase|uniref:GNAT family N-acetyltransferase n=1 Tax=Mycolicibacterium tusciae TaxID=75922 RepID=A0A1X0JZ20_9MYCO|nr:GNAT family N-acetyltransferase [Mycolicibacterium tusciae]ORB67845.1 GNAT family N-acetyltransferase [Mycolicibacterium tusciae]